MFTAMKPDISIQYTARQLRLEKAFGAPISRACGISSSAPASRWRADGRYRPEVSQRKVVAYSSPAHGTEALH